MKTENSDDLAIETLLAVCAELAEDLDVELLQRCYEIQKTHQFLPDRSHSAQAMDRLIEARVDAIISQGDKIGNAK